MPKCALPARLQNPDAWKGTDDDTWLMRWRIPLKGWCAFANRCPDGIAWSFLWLPGLFVLPFSIWFTGWSWWYLFPFILIPVKRKWRLMPTTIFAIKGKGNWRIENTDSTQIAPLTWHDFLVFPRLETSAASIMTPFYLSRVQRWCRWHVALQWPFLIQFHFYFHASDVPSASNEHDTDGQLIGGYRGWHRDGDEIFWGDGCFLGTVTK